MVRNIIAYAVVDKKRPRIDPLEIYTKEQVKEIAISNTEKIIKVIISEKR